MKHINILKQILKFPEKIYEDTLNTKNNEYAEWMGA